MPVFAFLHWASERRGKRKQRAGGLFEIGVQRTESYGYPVDDSEYTMYSLDSLFEIGMGRTESYGHPVQDHSFDHRDYHSIKFIEIRSGEWIDSLRIQYKRDGEELAWTDRVGGDGGHDNPTIELEDGEDIIEVKGKYGRRRDKTGIITSLTFTTNRGRSFGPYGQVSWWRRMTNTLVPFKIGGRVVGFHGTSGDFVSSIGCHIYGS